MFHHLRRYLPILSWAGTYRRSYAISDLLAAVIVTIMLIPQSLAYALLAGLPAEMGLYASILPLAAYALFGTSRTLSVGPVAVVSLMTAAAVGQVAAPGTAQAVVAAILLAFLSGAFLVMAGLLRLGFLANFLSHPVISGFITASGILIAVSQLKHILGISGQGESLYAQLVAMAGQLPDTNLPTVVIGIGAMAFLLWSRTGLKKLLMGLGVGRDVAAIAAKAGPVVAVVVTILCAWWLDLGEKGVALVGDVPTGLPAPGLPDFGAVPWPDLVIPAVLIAIIGFVESVSVGHTLAAKRRQRIDPNQELIGLGAANLAAGVSSGFPVTGGFSRSVVNFDAGAQTQASSLLTAAGIALAAMFLTPFLAYLPKATLAATIIVAVLSLVDLSILGRAWRYSLSEFIAVTATLGVTLVLGVEAGVICGVAASLAMHLYKTSRPHIAVIGQVPGTEHFRNVERHRVLTRPHTLSVRVDESLYFANASYLEDCILSLVAERPELRHVVLMCTAVNEIDMSALEALEAINDNLRDQDIRLHLSEVKGPVMDTLEKTDFLSHLTGQVFLSQHQAVATINQWEDGDDKAGNRPASA